METINWAWLRCACSSPSTVVFSAHRQYIVCVSCWLASLHIATKTIPIGISCLYYVPVISSHVGHMKNFNDAFDDEPHLFFFVHSYIEKPQFFVYYIEKWRMKTIKEESDFCLSRGSVKRFAFLCVLSLRSHSVNVFSRLPWWIFTQICSHWVYGRERRSKKEKNTIYYWHIDRSIHHSKIELYFNWIHNIPQLIDNEQHSLRCTNTRIPCMFSSCFMCTYEHSMSVQFLLVFLFDWFAVCQIRLNS